MTQDALDWLADWYTRHCDGNWEHNFGISIANIDNPGWTLTIDLTGTDLENVPFEEVRHNYEDETSWWKCSREGKTFRAVCGARELSAVIKVFRTWAESNR